MIEAKLIDFNRKFMQDYFKWCTEHQDIASDESRIDDLFAGMEAAWYKAPKKWLDGLSPIEYFHAIDDPQMYATMFIEYIKADMELPEPLVHCIAERKEALYPIFKGMLFAQATEDLSAEQMEDVRANIVLLFSELELGHPYARYIELLREIEDTESALAEELVYALEDAGAAVRPLLMDGYKTSTGRAKLAFLDLLASLEGDAEVYDILTAELAAGELPVAPVAGFLGRLGDARAIPLLEALLKEYVDMCYVDYRAIREAIEALGGDEAEELDFSGDPDYERVAHWDTEDDE